MVQLDGTYEFVSEENYVDYLKSLGLGDELVQKQAAIKDGLVIKPLSGDNLTISYGPKQVTFPLGKELEHTLSTGHPVKTTATVSGDTINFETKLTPDGSVVEKRVFKISDSGLVSTSSNNKAAVKAVRNYKRV